MFYNTTPLSTAERFWPATSSNMESHYTKTPEFDSKIDQNAKKHKNRQNDVIFTGLDCPKNQLLKNIKF